MKLLIGIVFITLSVSLVLLCKFLNLYLIIDKFLALFIMIMSLFSAYFGLKNLTSYFDYNRLKNKGLKVKAQIVEVKRTLLNVNQLPEYIVEVFYNHPTDNKIVFTEFEYFGDLNKNRYLQKGKEIDILIDPQNRENIYFKNVV
jgi:hypothetical protein